MSPGARMEYLESIVVRYPKSSKKQKTAILDEFCQRLATITANTQFISCILSNGLSGLNLKNVVNLQSITNPTL